MHISKRSRLTGIRTAMLLAVMVTASVFAFGQQPATEQRVANFKQSLAASQAALRKYEWIETTTVSMKGDVKSVKQNRVYYGADGKIQKVPITPAEAPAQQSSGRRGGRIRGAIVATKKEELTDYMKQAVELVHKYVPPDPSLVKYSKETNNVKVEPLDSNSKLRLSFPNFIKIGDLLSTTLDLKNNSIIDVNVSTFLETEKDAVVLNVLFGRLPDGASFSQKTILNAKAKKVTVVIENSGHRPL